MVGIAGDISLRLEPSSSAPARALPRVTVATISLSRWDRPAPAPHRRPLAQHFLGAGHDQSSSSGVAAPLRVGRLPTVPFGISCRTIEW